MDGNNTFEAFPSAHTQQNATVDDTYLYYGNEVVAVLTFILMIIMLVSIFGNLLVIITIVRNRNMRTRTNLLLCNLALADILVGTIDVPVAITTLIIGDWPFPEWFCKINAFMVGMCIMCSLHTLMYISIHKFFSIKNMFKAGLGLRIIFGMVLAAWSWAIFYNTMAAMGWTQEEYKSGASQCGPVVPRTPSQISHSVINKLCNFVIPLFVMTIFYSKIFAIVREHLERLDKLTDVKIRNSLIQQKRILKTLVIVLVCFCLCYVPYIIYSSSLVLFGKEKVNPIFNPLAYLAMYLNSACNPIIYSLMFPKFRKGFKDIICGRSTKADQRDNGMERTKFGVIVSSFRQSFKKSSSQPSLLNSTGRKYSKRYSQPNLPKTTIISLNHQNTNLPKLLSDPNIKRKSSLIPNTHTKDGDLIADPTKNRIKSYFASSDEDLHEENLVDECNIAARSSNIQEETEIDKLFAFPRPHYHRMLSLSAPDLIDLSPVVDFSEITYSNPFRVPLKSTSENNIFYKDSPFLDDTPSQPEVVLRPQKIFPNPPQSDRHTKARLSIANILTSVRKSFSEVYVMPSVDYEDEDCSEDVFFDLQRQDADGQSSLIASESEKY